MFDLISLKYSSKARVPGNICVYKEQEQTTKKKQVLKANKFLAFDFPSMLFY